MTIRVAPRVFKFHIQCVSYRFGPKGKITSTQYICIIRFLGFQTQYIQWEKILWSGLMTVKEHYAHSSTRRIINFQAYTYL